MKKIIAMLLCVALVAAMSVSAFAASPKGTEIWSVDQWVTELTKPSSKNDVQKLAAELAGAKDAYSKAVKAYNDGIKDAAKAVQAMQYATVAAYVKAATDLYEVNAANELNKAVAQFKIDLAAAIAPEAASSATYDSILAYAGLK